MHNESDSPVVAVLLAGGSGVRSGLDYPKQFLRLGGRTVLEHTIAIFEAEPSVDEIVLVLSAAWIDKTKDIVAAAGFTKVTAVIEGGRTRNESTLEAIGHLRDYAEAKLIVHDAVRPLLPADVVRTCVSALDNDQAVDVVIPTADTIVAIDGERITSIPERSRLRRGQTPQAFRLSTLRRAYELVTSEQLEHFTDDAAVVLAALPDVPVRVVEGSDENIKITHASDIYLADRLLQARQSGVSEGSECRNLAGAIVVVIGGTSGIGEGIVAEVESLGARGIALSRKTGDADVRSEKSIAAALELVHKEHERIDAVVNTAGVMAHGDVVDLSADEIVSEVETNILGTINVARAAHSYLSETQGHLLLFTSSSYTRGRAGYATYSATKAGVVNLSQALSEEWNASGIKVNCINPGRTNTPMRRRAFGIEREGTLLSVSEVSAKAVEVISSSMTGHIFDVRSSQPAVEERAQ